jgi:hypothetical protein
MNPTLVALLVQYGLQYGIPAAMEIIAVLRNSNATISDVEALFAKIKTYEQYNIPDITKK